MGTTNEAAIVGLDGLDPEDLNKYGFTDDWDLLQITTRAHTAPSWNAIFAGFERPGLYDFFKFPEDYEEHPDFDGGWTEMAKLTEEMWDYEELETDSYVWNQTDVEVVSAPVVLPTYSTLDERPRTDLTWPTTRAEFAESISTLTAKTLEQERVITVYPFPDKMNHMVHNEDKLYGRDDRFRQMRDLKSAVDALRENFDRWLILSDHGRPASNERIGETPLFVASHKSTGVVKSNCVETEGETNVSIYDRILEVLEG